MCPYTSSFDRLRSFQYMFSRTCPHSSIYMFSCTCPHSSIYMFSRACPHSSIYMFSLTCPHSSICSPVHVLFPVYVCLGLLSVNTKDVELKPSLLSSIATFKSHHSTAIFLVVTSCPHMALLPYMSSFQYMFSRTCPHSSICVHASLIIELIHILYFMT